MSVVELTIKLIVVAIAGIAAGYAVSMFTSATAAGIIGWLVSALVFWGLFL